MLCVQVDVYILRKTFLLLACELCINAPAIGEPFTCFIYLKHLTLEKQRMQSYRSFKV